MNCQPLFLLDNMPSEVFIDSAGFDSYGRIAYRRSTPEEHRYYWRVSPPEVPQEVVGGYQSCTSEDPYVPIAQLFKVREALTAIKAAFICSKST